MIEKITKNLIPVSIIVAGLLIAGAFLYLNQGKVKEPGEENLSPQQAAEKAINYINQNLLTEGNTASLINVSEERIVYRIHLKIGETEYDSYISKDGKFLFPEGYEIETESSEKEEKSSDDKLEVLAKCLSEKGAKFYGASWCGWCKKQKELFGEAVQYLPYIECSEGGTQQMTSECQEAGVTSFPTWEFKGEKESGFKSLEELADLSECSF